MSYEQAKLMYTRAYGKSDESFEKEWKATRPYLLNYATRLCGNTAVAQDILGESVIRAWKGYPKLVDTSKFSSWAFRIVWSVFKDMLRRGSSRVPECQQSDDDDLTDLFEQIEDPSPSPLDIAISDDLRNRLDDVLTWMPPKDRDLFRWCLDDKSVNEIAPMLGVNPKTVRTKLFYARRRAREILRAHDLEAA